MKKSLPALFAIVLLFSSKLQAQNPTWSENVACIVYSHCSNCHNSAGIAPFALITYADAFAQRINMLNDVTIKKMPPYLPNTSYQHYADEKILTDQEIS